MSEKISYRDFEHSDFDALFTMSLKLWPDFDKTDLQELLKRSALSDGVKILVAKTANNESIGFSIFALRTDYVEGATQSPTGYLEGIFVELNYRKMGIAKEFIRLGEQWCKEKGCCQIGSDTWLANTASRKFHKSLGFREEEELVHFLKDI